METPKPDPALAVANDALFGIWTPTAINVPENPEGFPNKDHVACLCVHHGEIRILQWNAYYKVWDGEDGDDFFCKLHEVTHWMPLPPMPNEKLCDGSMPPPVNPTEKP